MKIGQIIKCDFCKKNLVKEFAAQKKHKICAIEDKRQKNTEYQARRRRENKQLPKKQLKTKVTSKKGNKKFKKSSRKVQ